MTTVYAAGYLRAEKEHAQTRFFAFFPLTIASAMWIALSGNLVTLLIGYEVMTLATWPLVAHHGGAGARRGARIYVALLLTTSIGLLLPAIVWTWVIAGNTDFRPGGLLAGQADWVLTLLFALYLLGIGKAALMPVHRWLPAAMVAPPRCRRCCTRWPWSRPGCSPSSRSPCTCSGWRRCGLAAPRNR